MDHAAALAKEQLDTSQSAARAARMAAWAAIERLGRSHSGHRDCEMKPYRSPPMTFGDAAAAKLVLMVWCK
jgi:hypothetical protein